MNQLPTYIMKEFFTLSTEEIAILKKNNCTADNWANILVKHPFRPEAYRNVAFYGKTMLGTTCGKVKTPSGIELPAGISNATLFNVSVGDNVHIDGIANYIACYNIADDVIIRNVNTIECRPGATFGIGTEVSVLNETGGREVPIFESLSAHLAYIIAMYRHDELLIERLRDIIRRHTDAVRSDRGTIGESAKVINAGTITDVNIGPHAVIDSATRLSNGTLVSNAADPVSIGANVIADDFILSSGSIVADGAVLRHVFAGQAVQLTHLFSAHDSLFFANCACENGEAAAIFAGPYTVTMHKSSLLIAGMFSFLNAGSGSNQSNHMYKLGPIHQGLVERGSKTTSDSYLLWPARIGAFSLVMGRHVSHPDTSSLPFSYLIEASGKSHLVPGANLKSVGTIRDAQKWPRRDRRKDPHHLDFINFNLLSPYTVSKMMNGIELLDRIEATSGVTSQIYAYQGMVINASALRKGHQYYAMAIAKFMGNSLIKRLENCPNGSSEEIRRALKPNHPDGHGEWIDLSGLIAPKSVINKLCDDICKGSVDTTEAISERFARIAEDYYSMEWTWVASQFEKWYGKKLEDVTADDVVTIVKRWLEAVVTIDRHLCDDARKEFSHIVQVGFGCDSELVRSDDFGNVRGTYERDPFVTMVLKHIENKTNLGNELIARMNRC